MMSTKATNPEVLKKWQAAEKLVIYYDEWGYSCCGVPVHVGDMVDGVYVSELDTPIGGAPLYYDRHCNVAFDRATSFYVDGKVEKIQILAKCDKLPEPVLFDVPDTETQAPIDPATVYDGWVEEGFVITLSQPPFIRRAKKSKRKCVDKHTFAHLGSC